MSEWATSSVFGRKILDDWFVQIEIEYLEYESEQRKLGFEPISLDTFIEEKKKLFPENSWRGTDTADDFGLI